MPSQYPNQNTTMLRNEETESVQEQNGEAAKNHVTIVL
jgi:hypothetical protein